MDEISFGSYLFWMGVGASGVGLYFWVEGSRRKAGALITLLGALVALVTVKEFKVFITAITIAKFVGPSLVILTWGLLGYYIYLKKRHRVVSVAIPTPAEWTKRSESLEVISGARFLHQDVQLDGRKFIDCTFTRSNLRYDGLAPTLCGALCNFDQFTRDHIGTANPALAQWTQILTAIGLVHGVSIAADGKEVPQRDPNLQNIDDRIFHHVRNTYMALPWQQKYALKRIWSQASVSIGSLAQELTTCGFKAPETEILQPLIATGTFLSSNVNDIWITSADIRALLQHFFKESPLC
jgi:hypothetical protein